MTRPLPGLVIQLQTRPIPRLAAVLGAVRSGTSFYPYVSVGIRVLVGAASSSHDGWPGKASLNHAAWASRLSRVDKGRGWDGVARRGASQEMDANFLGLAGGQRGPAWGAERPGFSIYEILVFL